MPKKLSVLLASHSSTRLNSLEDLLLEAPDMKPTRGLLSERQRELGSEALGEADVVVLDLGQNWETTLAAMSAAGVGATVPMIALGQGNEPDMMRRAMQAGARDFFVSPMAEDELLDAVRRVGTEARLRRRQHSGDITVLVNGKGGSGATFLACSLGAVLAGRENEDAAGCTLVDMNLQFGTMPVYFDLPSSDNLANALRTSETLDPMTLESLTTRHASGVRLLANHPDERQELAEVSGTDVQALLGALARASAHVIVDLPRSIDAIGTAVLEMADRVLVVTQQSVPHVRDTKHLFGLLRTAGVAGSRIDLVINRYDPRSEVQLDDVEDAFADTTMHSVVNDHKRASFAVNNGILVPRKWPRAPITRSIERLAERVWVPVPRTGRHAGYRFFGRKRA